jgi:PPK2 family polyphosphate:nucleotide phosphotransferase
MDIDWIEREAHRLAKQYRVSNGGKFRLKEWDPADTGKFSNQDKPRAREALTLGLDGLAELQAMLYAQNRWSVLLIFQAMDAAGKDSAIKHVMSGIDPQGCQVFAYKAPHKEELDHDFMWRCLKNLPERGRIGIFNRSYYEEVLVAKVHPELLEAQQLPERLITPQIWKQRYQDISAIERYLYRNGIVVVKFFLNLSKEEQKRRFIERIDTPQKHWKFAAADVTERGHWSDYMAAYEQMIRHTATKHAPWYVVPADNKWYTRIVIAAAIIDTLRSLDLAWPTVSASERAALQRARAELMKERG